MGASPLDIRHLPWTEDAVRRNRFPLNNINACWFLLLVQCAQTVLKTENMKRKVWILVQQLCYQNETPKAESRTEKHWHSSPKTYLLGCEVAADSPSRFVPGESVVTTLTQKRAVFPTFSSREVTSGQMRKIGIHFITYRSKPHPRDYMLPCCSIQV